MIRTGAALALSIVALTVLSYWPAVRSGGFVWDDDSYVTGNELLTAPDGLRRIWLSPTESPQYYPLVFTTFRIERSLWGLDARGYHWTNVILHAGSALLLWRVLLALGVPGAFLAAAIFAVHPINAESVAWITERKNTLSGLFALGSLAAYLRFAGIGAAGSTRGRAIGWYAASFALFAAALASKTVTCTLPVVILILLWWKGRSDLLRHAALLAPFLAAGLAMGAVTAMLEVAHVGAAGSEWDLTPVDRVLVAGRVVWFYLGTLLWPAKLAFVYQRWAIDAASPIQWLWPVAAVAVSAALWLLRGRIGRGPAAACAIYVVTLGPALGFINVFPMRYAFVADHFAYLASIPVIAGIAAMLAWVAGRFAAKPWHTIQAVAPAVVLVAVPAVLSVLTVHTWRQATWYRDAEHLWRSTIAAEPLAAMPHYNLAKLLAGRGDPDSLNEAADQFYETLRIKPDAADVHENLGVLLGGLGRYEEAAAQLELAIAASPDDASAHGNLGTAYRMLGRSDDAVGHYQAAAAGEPAHVDHHLRLADLQAQLGRFPEAIAAVEAGVGHNPSDARLCNSLAAFLCRVPDPALRDGPGAVRYAELAVSLTQERELSYMHTLADALAEAGRLDEARAVALKTMQLAQAAGDTALYERVAQSLEAMRSRSNKAAGTATGPG